MSNAARKITAEIVAEEYGELIERIANSLVKDVHLAEDIRQDVILKLLSLEDDTLDKQPQTIKRFIYVMTKNHALNILKKRQREVFTDSMEHDGYMEQRYFEDKYGFSEEVQELLSKLEQIDRDIICMKYGDGFSYKEIARALDKTEDYIYQRMKRARDKMKQALATGGAL